MDDTATIEELQARVERLEKILTAVLAIAKKHPLGRQLVKTLGLLCAPHMLSWSR